MPRFFFHLHDRGRVFHDEDGKECGDVTEASVLALKSARAIVSADALDGFIDLSGRIEIADEQGVVVFTVLYCDAVAVRRADDHSRKQLLTFRTTRAIVWCAAAHSC
jgi:hypothetical protein